MTEEGGRARARCFVGNRPEPLSLEKEPPLLPPPPRPCQESSSPAFVSPAEPLEERGREKRRVKEGARVGAADAVHHVSEAGRRELAGSGRMGMDLDIGCGEPEAAPRSLKESS